MVCRFLLLLAFLKIAIGGPPCGYRSDPQDKDRWILDEDAAPVVKRIFDLTIVGGPSRIARILESDNVLTAKALYAQRKGKPAPERPCHWPEQSVVGILERMEYTGCVCNFKTYSKSYKLKKRISNAKEDMLSCPIRRRPSSRRSSGTKYKSCGRTSAASPRVSAKGCFPDFSSVPTAEVSSTLPLATGLRAGRTATFAPNTEADAGPARGILSGKKCCGMWCWSVFGP